MIAPQSNAPHDLIGRAADLHTINKLIRDFSSVDIVCISTTYYTTAIQFFVPGAHWNESSRRLFRVSPYCVSQIWLDELSEVANTDWTHYWAENIARTQSVVGLDLNGVSWSDGLLHIGGVNQLMSESMENPGFYTCGNCQKLYVSRAYRTKWCCVKCGRQGRKKRDDVVLSANPVTTYSKHDSGVTV